NDLMIITKPQLMEKETYESHLTSFVKELQAIPEVKDVSASFSVPSTGSWGLSVWKNSEDPGTQQVHTVNGVDANYFDIYDLKLLAGRNFDENRIADNNTVVISKKSMEILGFETPKDAIGANLKIETFRDSLFEIIGVIDDYHHYS